ncbi:MAG: 3-dehydroquinate synthase [Candidatus Azobacteroides sp.]|nr:3-dehydroquinate synthase [Candidatus Azobacteroides sp.]
MDKQKIIVSKDLNVSLSEALQMIDYDKLFVLTDEETALYCLPLIRDNEKIKDAGVIVIQAGDLHKTLDAVSGVWMYLSRNGASRKSAMVNLGGGMVTDLGGFAASSFKRGIPYINIPTTLLGAVDAAVGGKTGINFNGLKNEIGVFSPSKVVLIDTTFFQSLDRENILSGYAEMLKHGLISNDKNLSDLICFDPENIDYRRLQELLVISVKIKEKIVSEDPYEKGIRKALNLGHTVGHAFESFSFERNRPTLHGYAVAWGIICELYLSYCLTGFPADKLRQTIRFIRNHYGTFEIDCKDYDHLYELMTHDKKNESDRVNFTLLADVGDIRINQTADQKMIFEMFDFYRDNQ